jgi:hypothetical protein
MKQLLGSLVVVAALVAAQAAHAQGFGGYTPPATNPYPNRPMVSPYLNLARGGNSALNYYNLVVPQMTYNNNFQNLQIATQQLANTTNALAMQRPGTTGAFRTGHPVRFMDYNRYFQTVGVGMSGPYMNTISSGLQRVQTVSPQTLGNLNQPPR